MLFLFISCSPKTVNSIVDTKELLVDDESVRAKVVYDKNLDERCAWYIVLEDGVELLPVFWDEKLKVNNKKVNLKYSLSRAPQPSCFKGKMIVVDNYNLQ